MIGVHGVAETEGVSEHRGSQEKRIIMERD